MWMRRVGRVVAVAVLASLVFSACSAGTASLMPWKRSADDLAGVVAMVPQDGRLNTPFVRAGLAAIASRDYAKATRAFSRALKFDPRNAPLHALNGLSYHLRALGGDTSQYDLAEVGYQLALQFDPKLYHAAALLGHLRFAQGRFDEAAEQFAHALLFERGDVGLWLGLAVSAYYGGDLVIASAAIASAERLKPDAPNVLRTGLFVNAAAGSFDDALAALGRYRGQRGIRPGDAEYVAKRLEDWRELHREIRLAQLPSQTEGLPAPTPGGASGAPPGGVPGTPPGGAPAFGPSIGNPGFGTPGFAAPAPPGAPMKPGRMCLIDVVIIRSEETYRTNKGVNLLEGLRLQGTGSRTTTRNQTQVFRRHDTTTPQVNTLVNALTSTFTIPLVTYDLNIFNDEDDVNEILARPTLVGVDGKPSEFFSGSTLHVNVSGAAGSVGTIETIPVGIQLSIVPTFLDDTTVALSVSAARAFIEGQSTAASFTEFLQTAKTQVTANVVLKFDETLILSGLSEKENSRTKGGVPFLKNLPGVQYLFSNEQTNDFTRSVLILVTPRRARFTTEGVAAAAPPPAARPRIEDLKSLSHFRPAPNVDAAARHLHNLPLFREFRTGDVNLERWDTPDDLATLLLRILRFLYY